MTEEKSLPKPQKDLPLPEKEIPAETDKIRGFTPKSINPKWIIIGVVALFLFLIFAISAYLLLQNNAEKQVACTQEAKLCPDGVTYVSRHGPNCEFSKCPSSDSNQTTNWKTYSFKALTLRYPPTWKETTGSPGLWSNNSADNYIIFSHSFNYNIRTGTQFASLADLLTEADEKNIKYFKIDGTEASESINSNEDLGLDGGQISVRILSKDKKTIYYIIFQTKNLTEKETSLFNKILSTVIVDNKPADLTNGWKEFVNKNPGYSFLYPSELKIRQNGNNLEYYFDQSGSILKITNGNYTLNYNSYPLCSNLKEPLSQLCVSEINDTLVGGKTARIFSTSSGVDSGRIIIQVADPKLEINMFIAGGGLYERLNGILSTFKFTDENSNGFVCPSQKYIDCMPTVGNAKPLCDKDYLSWISENCPEVTVTY